MMIHELRASLNDAVAELEAAGKITADGELKNVPGAVPSKLVSPPPQAPAPLPVDEPVQFDPTVHASWDGLTPAQNLAMTALLGGDSVSRASRYVGVHRNTISRWKNHHPRFREIYDQMRLEMHEATLQQLRAASLDAAACVADQVVLEKNLQASLQLLRGLGYLNPRTAGCLSGVERMQPAPPAESPPSSQPPASRPTAGRSSGWRLERLWSLLLGLIVGLTIRGIHLFNRGRTILEREGVSPVAARRSSSRSTSWRERFAMLHYVAPFRTMPLNLWAASFCFSSSRNAKEPPSFPVTC